MGTINWKFWDKRLHSTIRTVRTNLTANISRPSDTFCSNAIISSRYTWYNFFPKNLYEQFHNLANIFFATIAILYMYADASTSIWANLGPLMAIIFITATKDGIEDILRHRRDRTLNREIYKVLQYDRFSELFIWTEIKAESLKVGDVVMCERDRSFPCDMLILASNNSSTELNVTTANLDGETNIKKYFAVDCTQTIYRQFAPDKSKELHATSTKSGPELLKNLLIQIQCQPPNVNLNHFEGCLNHAADTSDLNTPLTFSNLVLRGAKLKNTQFMIGLAAYTGPETKLSLNGKQSHRKYSSRESRSNVILLAFIIVMVVLAIIFSIVYYYWTRQTRDGMWYLPIRTETAWYFVQNVFRFIFILNYLIPISIIITIDFQQLLMAYLISSDIRMYSPETDLGAKANSSQLADELGQVEFLFSDKTGTLTQNIMSLCLFGVLESRSIYYFLPKPHKDASRDRLDGSISDSDSSSDDEDSECSETFDQPRPTSVRETYKQPNLEDPNFAKFLTFCALCHTVDLADHLEEKEGEDYASESGSEKTEYKYEALSPDEKAFVEGAASQGIVFVGSKPVVGSSSSKRYGLLHTQKNVNDDDDDTTSSQEVEKKDYIVDAVLEFTSERKRMTVMVRYPDGSCHIHSKGAESSMLDAQLCQPESGELRSLALKYVNEFALQGYRTLVFSTRQLEENVYQELLGDLLTARAKLGADRDKALVRAYDRIESELKPVFVSAVEDKLQNGVKECFHNLRNAGIQIWILTGDKEETAMTISHSSEHFTSNMGLIRLTKCYDFQTAACCLFQQLEGIQIRGEQRPGHRAGARRHMVSATEEELEDVLLAAVINNMDHPVERDKQVILEQFKSRLNSLVDVKNKMTDRLRRSRRRGRRPGTGGEPIGLVIDGMTLTYVLDPTLRDAFLDLCMNVTAVLCCRMTPLQKASLVLLVQVGLSHTKDGFGSPVTAAIGDGGNDVAMLQQANIGVGIYGKEGLEAARAADYSIPEFRYLTQLFLMHGHWAYHRLSYTMNLFYFKCTALVTTQVLLGFHSGFSQQVNISSLLFGLYNLTMNSLVYLLYGMFERHLPEKDLLHKPYLYRVISKQANLRSWYVLLWVLEGIWQGSVIYFTTYLALAGGSNLSPAIFYDVGLPARAMYELEYVGIAMYVALWLSANIRIALHMRDQNFVFLIGFSITACNFMFFYAIGKASFIGLFLSPAFWFTLPLAVILANLPALFWHVISDTWWTVQLIASNISHAKTRKQLKQCKKLWLLALFEGRLSSVDLGMFASSDEERPSKQTTNSTLAMKMQVIPVSLQ